MSTFGGFWNSDREQTSFPTAAPSSLDLDDETKVSRKQRKLHQNLQKQYEILAPFCADISDNIMSLDDHGQGPGSLAAAVPAQVAAALEMPRDTVSEQFTANMCLLSSIQFASRDMSDEQVQQILEAHPRAAKHLQLHRGGGDLWEGARQLQGRTIQSSFEAAPSPESNELQRAASRVDGYVDRHGRIDDDKRLYHDDAAIITAALLDPHAQEQMKTLDPVFEESRRRVNEGVGPVAENACITPVVRPELQMVRGRADNLDEVYEFGAKGTAGANNVVLISSDVMDQAAAMQEPGQHKLDHTIIHELVHTTQDRRPNREMRMPGSHMYLEGTTEALSRRIGEPDSPGFEGAEHSNSYELETRMMERIASMNSDSPEGSHEQLVKMNQMGAGERLETIAKTVGHENPQSVDPKQLYDSVLPHNGSIKSQADVERAVQTFDSDFDKAIQRPSQVKEREGPEVSEDGRPNLSSFSEASHEDISSGHDGMSVSDRDRSQSMSF